MLEKESYEGLISPNQKQFRRQIIKTKETSPKEKEQKGHRKKQKKNQRSEITYILKTLNFLVGIGYIGFAIYCYAYGYLQTELTTKGPFIRYVLPTYVGISGLLILLIECGVGLMVRNLRFFYNYFGRGLFNVYAGLMPLMLINDWSKVDTFEIITIVVSSIMCVIGLLYMALKCFCCEKEGVRLYEEQKKRKRKLKIDQDENQKQRIRRHSIDQDYQ